MSLHIGIPLFLIAALLQATVFPQFRVFDGQPDLLVVIVLAWAIVDQGQEGVVWAFVGGFVLDLFSGAPLGVSSLALVPVAYSINILESQLYRESVLLPIALMAGGSAVYHLLYLILLRFLVGYRVIWSDALLFVSLPSIVIDMILIVPALQVLAVLYDLSHPKRVSI